MRDLSVYYCRKCGHYAYFQLPKNAVCPRCHKELFLIELHYQEFMELDHNERDMLISQLIIQNSPDYIQRLFASDKLFNHREAIGRLTEEISQLQNENQKLNETVEWMHQTIWEQLGRIKQLERELHELQEMK